MMRLLCFTVAVTMFIQPSLAAASEALQAGVSQFMTSAVEGGLLAADTPSSPVATPCDDPQFVLLKQKPLDQMSPREYEYFQQKDKECTEFRKLQLERTAAPRQTESQTPVAEYARKEGQSSGILIGIAIVCGGLLILSLIAAAGSSSTTN